MAAIDHSDTGHVSRLKTQQYNAYVVHQTVNVAMSSFYENVKNLINKDEKLVLMFFLVLILG